MNFAQCSHRRSCRYLLSQRDEVCSPLVSALLCQATQKSPRYFLAHSILREVEGAGLLLSLAIASPEPLRNGCLPYKAFPSGFSYWEPQWKTALPNVSDCWEEHGIKPETTRRTDEQRNPDVLFGIEAVLWCHVRLESRQLAALGHSAARWLHPDLAPCPAPSSRGAVNHLTPRLVTLFPSTSQSLYVGLEVHNPHFAEGWGCCSDFPKLAQEIWAEPRTDHRFPACQVTSSTLG